MSNREHRRSMQVNQGAIDSYLYDAFDQLTGVKYSGNQTDYALATGTREVQYDFDPMGNREQVADTAYGTATYTTNALNQYTAVSSGGALSYDANGNLNGQGVLSFTYDGKNRLLSATGAGHTVSMVYDAANRLISRTTDGVATYFIWDGWNLIEERNASDAQIAGYVHGPRVDEILAKTDTTGTIYYHEDALGSVAALSNDAGVSVETYRYDVFGAVSIMDGAGSPRAATAYGNRFFFTGREGDPLTGLYDYRNRVYSAVLGRFLQTDPIRFEAGDGNLYRYVKNRNVSHVDPDCLIDWSINACYARAAGKHARAISFLYNRMSVVCDCQNPGYDPGTCNSLKAQKSAADAQLEIDRALCNGRPPPGGGQPPIPYPPEDGGGDAEWENDPISPPQEPPGDDGDGSILFPPVVLPVPGWDDGEGPILFP